MQAKIEMAKEIIDLKNYNQIKNLTNGKTNEVWLWENKNNCEDKIVTKHPHSAFMEKNDFPALIKNNITSINSFFGENVAWEIEDDPHTFAMRFFEGSPLPEDTSDDNLTKFQTLTRNNISYTILDPNKNNFIQLKNGEIIPIDFDYMIVHDNSELLPYQELFLNSRAARLQRIYDATPEEAFEYVLNSYPLAKEYLSARWAYPIKEEASNNILQEELDESLLSTEYLIQTILSHSEGKNTSFWEYISRSQKIEAGYSGSADCPALATPDYQINYNNGNLTLVEKKNGLEIDNENTKKQVFEAVEQAILETSMIRLHNVIYSKISLPIPFSNRNFVEKCNSAGIHTNPEAKNWSIAINRHKQLSFKSANYHITPSNNQFSIKNKKGEVLAGNDYLEALRDFNSVLDNSKNQQPTMKM